jgi:hypothetical protein
MTAPNGGATDAQLLALQVFKYLTSTAEGRQEWLSAERGQKEEVFNAHRSGELANADYGALPDKVRSLLETLSDSELALLSDIDATFVGSGVTVPNVPMMAH